MKRVSIPSNCLVVKERFVSARSFFCAYFYVYNVTFLYNKGVSHRFESVIHSGYAWQDCLLGLPIFHLIQLTMLLYIVRFLSYHNISVLPRPRLYFHCLLIDPRKIGGVVEAGVLLLLNRNLYATSYNFRLLCCRSIGFGNSAKAISILIYFSSSVIDCDIVILQA